MVSNPRILLLDEATSPIIQKNMRQICRGRTVFIIAHRLSALRFVDRILVMERGQIVEQGTEPELLIAQGYYARLHAHQFNRPLSAVSG